jgi:hypothetical protein
MHSVSSYLEATMRVSLPVLAGSAAIAAGAAMTPALAQDSQVHVLTMQLPGGGVEHIQYIGDVAPRVVLMPAPAMVAVPMMAGDPFATLERISAMMDQQAAAMMRQVNAIPALPPGVNGYSFASTMSGSGVCTHSVRITFTGNGKPQMVSSTSGDCSAERGGQSPADVNVPAPVSRPEASPRTIEAKALGGPAREVAWNR